MVKIIQKWDKIKLFGSMGLYILMQHGANVKTK